MTDEEKKKHNENQKCSPIFLFLFLSCSQETRKENLLLQLIELRVY